MLRFPGPVLSFFFPSTEPVSYHHRPRGVSSRDSEETTEEKPRQADKGKSEGEGDTLVEGAS